ncbi:MAG: immunoglobulin domain-containing protein, partial [Verrucomicrobiota bacterium]
MLFFKHLFRSIGLPLIWLGFITPFGVCAQPVIFLQPVGQEAGIGTDVTFNVGARNDTPLPLRYHWRLNGALLRGATNATLTVSNVQPGNAGSYSVTVADHGASVNSAIARLTL